MRIALVIEYDGTNYCGWQVQPNGVTIEQVIESAIFSLTNCKTKLVGSGRTDSGVHAKGQIAHFDTQSSIPPEKFAYALESLLPNDIAVRSSFLVTDNFHARFSAKRKTYCYRMYKSNIKSPLNDRYALQVSQNLDVELMQQACKYYIGTHDFAGFVASNTAVKNTVRTIFSAEVVQTNHLIEFFVCGNGFLYNMVRIMAGTLVDVGLKKIKPCQLGSLIENKTRASLGKTLPAKGLTLMSVEYN